VLAPGGQAFIAMSLLCIAALQVAFSLLRFQY
jgi:hypothetical protein